MILSLGVITVVAGGVLGGVYALTKEPIARQAMEQQTSAIREVAPPFNNNPEEDKWITEINGVEFTVYPAILDDELNGAAVKGSSMNGFSGEITIMCGFEKDGTVNDYRVLQMAETPGLGSKMETWFRDPTASRSVLGKNPGNVSFYVSKDAGGEIDAITAATISSRAFLEAMRDAYQAYSRYAQKTGIDMASAEKTDASSGASKSNKSKESNE